MESDHQRHGANKSFKHENQALKPMRDHKKGYGTMAMVQRNPQIHKSLDMAHMMSMDQYTAAKIVGFDPIPRCFLSTFGRLPDLTRRAPLNCLEEKTSSIGQSPSKSAINEG